jgi:hypothetical protein
VFFGFGTNGKLYLVIFHFYKKIVATLTRSMKYNH